MSMRLRDHSFVVFVVALLPGCAGDAPAPPRETTPYAPGIPAPVSAASIVPDVAASAVPAMFHAIAVLDPRGAFEKYLAFYALAEGDDCLEREVHQTANETNVFWYAEGCALANGAWFEGSGAHVVSRATEEGATVEYTSFGDDGARFDMSAPDGTYMRGSPSVEFLSVRYPDGSAEYEAYFSGHFESDPTTAAGNPWLAGEIEGTFAIYAFDDGAGGRSIGYYEVALLGAPGGSDIAFATSAFEVDDDPACPARSGTIAMRDRDGGWHDADFGAVDAAAACDVCADLSFEGAALGSFCTSETTFVDLLAWETAPW